MPQRTPKPDPGTDKDKNKKEEKPKFLNDGQFVRATIDFRLADSAGGAGTVKMIKKGDLLRIVGDVGPPKGHAYWATPVDATGAGEVKDGVSLQGVLSTYYVEDAAAPALGASSATMISNVQSCDGGLGLWEAATKGNGGKAPKVVLGTPDGGFLGDTDTTTGTITILKTLDLCVGTQTLVQELSNMSRNTDFHTLDADAAKGDVNRADYIRGNERIEYETGVLNSLKALDACSTKWGCSKGVVGTKEGFRKAKDFDDYLNHFLASSHKEFYGTFWDKNYQAAWKAKHP